MFAPQKIYLRILLCIFHRILREGKECRRLWTQRKTSRPSKVVEGIQDVSRIEPEKEFSGLKLFPLVLFIVVIYNWIFWICCFSKPNISSFAVFSSFFTILAPMRISDLTWIRNPNRFVTQTDPKNCELKPNQTDFETKPNWNNFSTPLGWILEPKLVVIWTENWKQKKKTEMCDPIQDYCSVL